MLRRHGKWGPKRVVAVVAAVEVSKFVGDGVGGEWESTFCLRFRRTVYPCNPTRCQSRTIIVNFVPSKIKCV